MGGEQSGGFQKQRKGGGRAARETGGRREVTQPALATAPSLALGVWT